MKNINRNKSHDLHRQRKFIEDKIIEISAFIRNNQFDIAIIASSDLIDNYSIPPDLKLHILSSRALAFGMSALHDKAFNDQLEFINIYEADNNKINYDKTLRNLFDSKCLSLVQAYFKKNDLKTGEKFLQKISKTGRNILKYKELLYFLFMEQTQYKKALEILDEVCRDPLGSNKAINFYNKGSCYFTLGNLAEAKTFLSKALELDPNLIEAKLILIQIDIISCNLDLVEKKLQNIFEVYLQLNKELFFHTRGLYYASKQNYKLAEINYRLALSSNSNRVNIKCSLASIYIKQGRIKEFELIYENLKALHSDNLFFKMLQTYYYYSIGKKEECKKLLSELKYLEPNNLDLIKFEIETLLIEKEYGSVIDLATQALILNPRDPVILQNLGKAYLHKKEYDLAFKYLTQAYDIYSDLEDIKTDLGNYYFHKKDYNKAIEYYTNEQGAESNIRVLNNLAASYYALGQYENTIDNLLKALKLNPFDYRLYTHLGLSYLKTETYNKALDCFKIAITFNPSSKLSLNSYIEEAVSNIGIEQSDDLIKEMREMSLDKKRAIGKANKYEKAAFKLYRTQTELEKTKVKVNEKSGWGDKYPKPSDVGVSTLSWKGYDVEKSRVYGWLDESNAEIAKLDEQVKIRIRGILKEGTFTDRVKNQQGIKYYDKHTVAIKNLGAMGAGDIRIIGRRIKNITGESLYVFDEVRKH